jgi:hypothetical protein
MAVTTTSGSQTLPETTVTVVSNGAIGFATSGTLYIFGASGVQTVTYTGGNGASSGGFFTSGTTFTGCLGGTGTVLVGSSVVQSTEQNTTVYLDGELDVTSALATGFIAVNTGTYNNKFSSQSNQNNGGGFSNDFGTTSLNKTPIPDPLPPVTGQLTKYFKMVGFYATGAVYEQFVSIGAPSAATATNPNTGHTLINCYVSTIWQQ